MAMEAVFRGWIRGAICRGTDCPYPDLADQPGPGTAEHGGSGPGRAAASEAIGRTSPLYRPAFPDAVPVLGGTGGAGKRGGGVFAYFAFLGGAPAAAGPGKMVYYGCAGHGGSHTGL